MTDTSQPIGLTNYTIATMPFPHPQDPFLLDYVMDALRMRCLIPRHSPVTDLLPHFTSDRLSRFYLERRWRGWVANLEFHDVPPGQPDTLGTPDAWPIWNKRKAFLHGAALVCKVVTGSTELPFMVVGGELSFAHYRPKGPSDGEGRYDRYR